MRSARYEALRTCWSSSNSLAVEPLLEPPDAGRRGRRRRGVARPVSVADRVELPAAVEDDADRDREQDRLARDERDDEPVHAGEHRTGRMGTVPCAARRCPLTTRRPAPTAAPPSRRSPRRKPVRLRLIPREERFFDLFVEDAANVLGGARLLEAMLRTYDEPEARARRDPGDASTAATRSATTSATGSRRRSSRRSTARTSTP